MDFYNKDDIPYVGGVYLQKNSKKQMISNMPMTVKQIHKAGLSKDLKHVTHEFYYENVGLCLWLQKEFQQLAYKDWLHSMVCLGFQNDQVSIFFSVNLFGFFGHKK